MSLDSEQPVPLDGTCHSRCTEHRTGWQIFNRFMTMTLISI